MQAPTRPWVSGGFREVEACFADLVEEGPGMAMAATVDGMPVVDLWGGTFGSGRPFEATTPGLLFSGTKGVVATAMLMLIDRGRLSLDQPLTEIWPEFGRAGKGEVCVLHVLSHSSGLPGWAENVSGLLDQKELASLLAGQPPLVPIGQPSYHALTFGSLCDAIIRRIDGRSTGQFVADEIVAPLGLDMWIGTPPEVARRTAIPWRRDDFRLAAELAPDPDPRLSLVYGSMAELDWSEVLGVEVPAANGVGTARSLARLYGCLARDGEVDRVRLLSPPTVALARQELVHGPDVLSGRALRFSAGFELTGTPSQLGPIPDAFGFTGSGGSSHGAWPSLRTGYSILITEMRPETKDSRAQRLLEALASAVSGYRH